MKTRNTKVHPWPTNDGVYFTTLNHRPCRLMEFREFTVLLEIAKPSHPSIIAEAKEIIGEFCIFLLEVPINTFLNYTAA